MLLPATSTAHFGFILPLFKSQSPEGERQGGEGRGVGPNGCYSSSSFSSPPHTHTQAFSPSFFSFLPSYLPPHATPSQREDDKDVVSGVWDGQDRTRMMEFLYYFYECICTWVASSLNYNATKRTICVCVPFAFVLIWLVVMVTTTALPAKKREEAGDCCSLLLLPLPPVCVCCVSLLFFIH